MQTRKRMDYYGFHARVNASQSQYSEHFPSHLKATYKEALAWLRQHSTHANTSLEPPGFRVFIFQQC